MNEWTYNSEEIQALKDLSKHKRWLEEVFNGRLEIVYLRDKTGEFTFDNIDPIDEFDKHRIN